MLIGQNLRTPVSRVSGAADVDHGRRPELTQKPQSSETMKTPAPHRSITAFAAFASFATIIAFSLSLSSGAADTSAKGAERLMQIGSPTSQRAVSADKLASAIHAGCSECNTVATKRTPEPIKGAQVLAGQGVPATFVSTHGCDACTTTIGVSGHGKAKAQTVTHGCSRPMLASATCCK